MDRPAHAQTLLERGMACIDAGHLDEACEALVEALVEAPGNPDVIVQLGKLALLAGMPEDACNILNEAILGPRDGRQKALALHTELVRDGRATEAAVVWSLLGRGPSETDVVPADAEGEDDLQSDLQRLYSRYRVEATRMIEAGRRGELRLTPDELWLGLTTNCNLRCVGCYFDGKFTRSYVSLDDVRQAIRCDGPIKQISFTSYGEALLHPQFCDIIELCREAHPQARLWVICNGTLPIRGRYRRALSMLDKVGLSIDGATKQTYESIRVGAVFETFLENARRIVQLRDETGFPRVVTFSFTATATNLHELVGVIRLAKEIGVDDVWAQSMEAKNVEVSRKISDILIDNLPRSERAALIDEARAEAQRIGVPLFFSEGLYASREKSADADDGADGDLSVRLCRYPWGQPAQVAAIGSGYVAIPCCYIVPTKMDYLAERHGLRYESLPPMDEMYNSKEFWQFREDLMEGKAQDVCGDCSAARDYQWTPGLEA